METIFEHKYEAGKVVYTETGITFYPVLSRHSLMIPWSNVDFVSPTPAVKLHNKEWSTFDGRSLKGLDYFNISIVLKNRRLVSLNTNLIEKLWFYVNFPVIKVTYGADDKQKVYEGFMKYKMKLPTLNRPLEELLNFFAIYSRYDLLCSFD